MSSNNKRRKKKLVIKKRFFVICIFIILIVLFFVIMGIKSVAGMIFGNSNEESKAVANDSAVKVEQNVDAANKESDQKGDDTNKQENISVNKDEGNSYIFDEVKSQGSMENAISEAVLSSWYISPLGQKRSTIEENFGVLNRSEDWNGKIYYHKSFVNTMYITYKGKTGYDDLPTTDAVCDSVSIALGNIKDFKRFTPNSEIWGEIQSSEGNLGEEYYYSVRIRNDVKLIVYCEKDGSITKDTHIVVSTI